MGDGGGVCPFEMYLDCIVTIGENFVCITRPCRYMCVCVYTASMCVSNLFSRMCACMSRGIVSIVCDIIGAQNSQN